jgi:hypothetical protein
MAGDSASCLPRFSMNVFVTKAKAEAVPLHATEALGGRGDIAPTHS